MKSAQSFNELYTQVAARKIPFLLVFFGIVTISYGVLFAIDFIPEPVSEETKAEKAAEKSVIERVGSVINGGLVPQAATGPAEDDPNAVRVIIPDADEPKEPETTSSNTTSDAIVTGNALLPLSITLDPLNKTVPVNNPASRDFSVLDQALLSGAVRHPDSADFGEPGNMFILAHSSYLPNVFNKHFQAFNGIQELTWGDTVRVTSADTEYVYQVDRVYKAKASEVTVPVTKGSAKLTLATCNSFATKDDRFIVEATLIDSYTI